MEVLIALIILIGAWLLIARALKGKGRGFVVRHLAGFAVSFVCVGIFAVIVGSRNTDVNITAQSTNAAADTPTSEKAAMTELLSPKTTTLTVTSSRLFSEYEENEVAADQKYKGKSIRVNGTVQSIDKDFLDHIVIKLKTTNPFMETHAYLDDKHEQLAASLKKNQNIVFMCVGDGLMVGSPILRDCAPS